MTLVRISLPSLDAEAVVEQTHTGSKITLRGGETVSIDLDMRWPTTIHLSVPAAVYKHKLPPLESEKEPDNWYDEFKK